ncbi:hypothetical protein [Vibrio sp. Hal054]|uniref:hypothetical protein n=1 Tax=Vibrio sp. Hal054 TaxID=3035158 RepID=UPI00301B9AD4
MRIEVSHPSTCRKEPMPITALILDKLTSVGVSVPLLEIDGNDDNLFITEDNTSAYRHVYLRIRFDDEFYNNDPVYFVEAFIRQHSGGDISYQGNRLEFPPEDIPNVIGIIAHRFMGYVANAC